MVATTGSVSIEWANVYLEEIRLDAHQLLAWSFADTKQEIARARDECDITGLLAEAMKRRLAHDATPDRYNHYSIHNEQPVSPRGELGKDRPRLDIQVQRNGVKAPRPQLTVEAKRLRDDRSARATRSLVGYLGSEGVGRFLKGRYDAGSPEVLMLGLVQARDAQFWFARVDASFRDDSNFGGVEYAVLEHLEAVRVHPDFCDEQASLHRTEAGVRLRIFHLFVDCR